MTIRGRYQLQIADFVRHSRPGRERRSGADQPILAGLASPVGCPPTFTGSATGVTPARPFKATRPTYMVTALGDRLYGSCAASLLLQLARKPSTHRLPTAAIRLPVWTWPARRRAQPRCRIARCNGTRAARSARAMRAVSLCLAAGRRLGQRAPYLCSFFQLPSGGHRPSDPGR